MDVVENDDAQSDEYDELSGIWVPWFFHLQLELAPSSPQRHSWMAAVWAQVQDTSKQAELYEMQLWMDICLPIENP